MNDWQPIETGPKDGEHVLVYADGFAHVAKWYCGDWCIVTATGDAWDDGWPFNINPTHWMPLPEPPKP